MTKNYATTPTKTTPYEIDDETMVAIGKIIRSFAELDNCLNLYIGGLAELSESRTSILLGRMNISAKIDKAGYLASMTGETITEIHNTLFDYKFRTFLMCRNTLAHGRLLGETENGALAFLINQTLESENKAAKFVVVTYTTKTILETAINMEKYMEMLITELKLQPLRDKQSQQPLGAHPKGRFQQKKPKAP